MELFLIFRYFIEIPKNIFDCFLWLNSRQIAQGREICVITSPPPQITVKIEKQNIQIHKMHTAYNK
jgi:hypothetical protein